VTQLNPYPDYVHSGVEWLARVPAHWATEPIGKLFTERRTTVSDADFQPLSVTRAGIVPQLENVAKTDNGEGRKLVRSGDFAINSRSDRKGSSGISDRDGSVSVITTVLTPREMDPAYLHHLLRSEPFQEEFYRYGSGIVADLWSTRWSAMKGIRLVVPPLVEQRRIAAFLDRETAEIDAFIADQEELIGLLAERRAATKTRHFEQVVRIEHGGDGSPLNVAISESDVRVGRSERELMSVSIHRGLLPWSEMHDKEPSSDNFETYKVVEPGDVVLNRMRAFQGAAGVSQQRGMVSPDYAVFKVSPLCVPEYISELLRSTPMIEAIKLRLRGIGDGDSGTVRTPRINVRDLVRIKTDLPDREGQRRAFETLTNETTELNAAIADARDAIALSRERRAALISAAVTGKIDVREHGAVK